MGKYSTEEEIMGTEFALAMITATIVFVFDVGLRESNPDMVHYSRYCFNRDANFDHLSFWYFSHVEC